MRKKWFGIPSSFIDRKPKSKTGNISGYNLQRSKNVKFDVIDGQLASSKIKMIRKWLNSNSKLSSKIIFTGQEEDQNEAKSFLIKAFFVAIF